jgi:hypothetical protein
LAWLVIPGPDIKASHASANKVIPVAGFSHQHVEAPKQPFPVIGEAIPEAPVNEEGALITLRSMDVCKIKVEGQGKVVEQAVRVSEPWKARMRGPFSIYMDNAGVAILEVAGKRVRHGLDVGKPWSGNFDENGQFVPPPPKESETQPNPPETEYTEAPSP